MLESKILLQSKRLILKSGTIEDLDKISDLWACPEVMRYIKTGVQTKEQAKEWILAS